MELTGIHHVKLPVGDVARSRAWYERVLGFEVASRFFYDSWTRAFGHRSERSQHRSDARRQARLRQQESQE